MYKIPLWAHRGYSGKYPENTIPAFVGAVEVGADGIECDVRETLDGHLVIMHDNDVSRTTNGIGEISQMTLQQVEQLDAGIRFAPAFAGTGVPTLGSVVDFIGRQHPSFTLNLEWKSAVSNRSTLQRVMRHIRQLGLLRRVVHSAFDDGILRMIQSCDPEAMVAVLTEICTESEIVRATELSAVAIHPNHLTLTHRFVQRAHEHGLHVHPFTINDPKGYAWMEDCQVDAVITNWPDAQWMLSGSLHASGRSEP